MYPNLYYLFQDLFGIEIGLLKIVQSFGFFVALAFIIGNGIWTIEIKRKARLGLLKSQFKKVLIGEKAPVSTYFVSSLVSFVFGYKLGLLLTDYDFFISNPQKALLSPHGNLLIGLIAAGVSFYFKYKELKAKELPEPKWVEQEITPESHVGNMTMLAGLFGILGAKLFHLLENPGEVKFLFTSIQSFFSGLTMYGGLICGAIAVLIYAKKNGLNLPHVVDSSAPTLMIAYGIGRIGCQIAGDGDWGVDNLAAQPSWLSFLPEWTWAYTYPHNVNEVGVSIPNCVGPYCYELANPVWPTPFYETIMSFVFFGILWGIRKKIQVPGILFSIYLIFNGLERFFIEKIRVNEHLFGTKITQAEIISMSLVIIGVFGIWYLNRHKERLS